MLDEYDVIIKDAYIVDGSSKAPYKGSVGVKGDKVAAAEHHNLKGRSTITPGSYADITVFSLDKLEIVSTPVEPNKHPKGIEYVFVNGEAVVEKGRHTSATPSRVLRRA